MVEVEWRYRTYLGPNDAIAPKWGGYWITESDDLMARVWHDDMADTWKWDVTEADEVEYGGTPCSFGDTVTRDKAQAEVEDYLRTC